MYETERNISACNLLQMKLKLAIVDDHQIMFVTFSLSSFLIAQLDRSINLFK